MTGSSLHRAFIAAARHFPDREAVVEPGVGSITYTGLDALSGQVRDRLMAMGVCPGDRVGLYVRKSIDTVAAIYGILRAGATYVPVDPSAPPTRNAYILHNCSVKAVLLESRFLAGLADAFPEDRLLPPQIVLEGTGAGKPLRQALAEADVAQPAQVQGDAHPGSDALAYILYTSGSTGKPKGVMLSHENAVSFVDWCSSVFEPSELDRLSSHAPFHFDLSILDIHLALKHGAALVLVEEARGKDPLHLANLIAEHRITIWYSAPSILALMAQFGKLPEHDCSSLRLILFAGEVFPVKHLRALCEQLQGPRYFNLYGPTETNVCTFYEVIPPVPESRTIPYPIGKICSHLRGRVVDEHDRYVPAGAEGELCITGRGVMQGYWSLPERTAQAFLVDEDGTRWYRTGDIVIAEQSADFTYRGRHDRMVKRRGYRVELGEIEAALYQHPAVEEIAVFAHPDEDAGVRIVACLSCREPTPPSMIALKRFCSERLPLYMIPDRFEWLKRLPKTSTDKTDYQRLKELY